MARDYPRIVTALPGPKAAKLIDRDSRAMSQNYSKDYPLVAANGKGAMVEDVDGNRFLDFGAGIAVVSTGHSHPEVVAAVKAQAERFLHMCYTDFYYETLIELAERLAARGPGPGPWRVFFANSGAEVVEGAMKLARVRTGRQKVIAFYGAFHGRTYGAMSLTASKLVQKRGYGPFLPEVYHSHYANCYRSPVVWTRPSISLDGFRPGFPGDRPVVTRRCEELRARHFHIFSQALVPVVIGAAPQQVEFHDQYIRFRQ